MLPAYSQMRISAHTSSTWSSCCSWCALAALLWPTMCCGTGAWQTQRQATLHGLLPFNMHALCSCFQPIHWSC